MLLACVQTDVAFGDLQSNLETVLRRVEQAGQKHADLVVFPECMLCGYGFESREEALASAIPADAPVLTQIASKAADFSTAVTIGFLLREKHEGGGERLFNATALLDQGKVAALYRKVHLPHLGVDRFVDRGDRPYAVDEVRLPRGGDVRVGMAICYDCSFPEPMRVLGLAGADVIALGTNWPVAATRTAEIVPPARSMENHLFFVAANRIGSERGFTYCGHSSICGPDGVELARAEGDEETILFAEADVNQARNKRIERTVGKHVIDRFADRQPAYYSPVSD